MRIIIFTGKGGGGVSTLAAATAVAISQTGRKTLAFGLARGVGAAFGVNLTDEPAEVGNNLDALEGQPGRDTIDEFRDWLEDLLQWRGMDVGLAEDIAALPGMNHVGRLLELEHEAKEGGYDVIVVDGASLEQFLDLPAALDAAERWLGRLFAPRQSNVFEPFLRVFAGEYASTGEDILDRGRDLLGRLADLRDLFADPEVTSVRLVLRPDEDAVDDAREAVTVLSLFQYATDAIIFNRVLPLTLKGALFSAALKIQADARRVMISEMRPTPVMDAPLSPATPRGLDSLAGFATETYGEHFATRLLHRPLRHLFSEKDGRHMLSLVLPFANRDSVRLERIEDGLAVHLNGRRCVLPLPDGARYREPSGWSFEAPLLNVTFK